MTEDIRVRGWRGLWMYHLHPLIPGRICIFCAIDHADWYNNMWLKYLRWKVKRMAPRIKELECKLWPDE